MKRELRPRAPVPIVPVCVSQITSAAILGVDERRFLELVVPRCERVSRVGRLRLVEVEEALRALRSLSLPDGEESRAESDGAATDDAEEEQGEFGSVDDVLRKLGRRRVGGAAR